MGSVIRSIDLMREGGADRSLRRSAEHGATVRIARGRYFPASDWRDLDPDAQYRAQIHAFAETTRATPIFSHWSAAALWGYPVIGGWPRTVHVTLNPQSGQRSSRWATRHLAEIVDHEVGEVDGLCVTSPLRTLIDLAKCAAFETGVAAVDRALAPLIRDEVPVPRVERGDLVDAFERQSGQRGASRLRKVVEFADGRSGSPGESLSRVQIARIGLPRPELQVEVVDRDGRVWHSDFGWESCAMLGEFDGISKYTRNRYLKGRDVSDVVIEEKLREDAIRLSSGCGMVRWTWPIASDPVKLKQLLVTARVRPGR